MTCEVLGVPYSGAKSADELTDGDRYVAIVMSEARRIYREESERKR